MSEDFENKTLREQEELYHVDQLIGVFSWNRPFKYDDVSIAAKSLGFVIKSGGAGKDIAFDFLMSAIPPFPHEVKDDKKRRRAGYAIWALGLAGDGRAVDMLVSIAAANIGVPSDLRTPALGALEMIGDARAIEPLRALVEKLEKSDDPFRQKNYISSVITAIEAANPEPARPQISSAATRPANSGLDGPKG